MRQIKNEIQINHPVIEDKQPDLKAKNQFNTMNLLIVEDNQPERSRLIILMHNQGFNVFDAKNGEDALAILAETQIDILLCDWMMPLLDGFSLCKLIQKLSIPTPYFILLTSRDSTCDLVAAMDAGADDYIIKPFDTEELRVRVLSGMRQRQKRDNFEKIEYKLIREKSQNDYDAIVQKQSPLPSSKIEVISDSRFIDLDSQSNKLNYSQLNHLLSLNNHSSDDIPSLTFSKARNNTVYFYHVSTSLAEFSTKAFTKILELEIQAITKAKQISDERSIDEFSQRILNKHVPNNIPLQEITFILGAISLKDGETEISSIGHYNPVLLSKTAFVRPKRTTHSLVNKNSLTHQHTFKFVLSKDTQLIIYDNNIYNLEIESKVPLTASKLSRVFHSLKSLNQKSLVENLTLFLKRVQSHKNDDFTMFFIERTIPVTS